MIKGISKSDSDAIWKASFKFLTETDLTMMQQGVTFFYRLFDFFDSEQIASIDGINDQLQQFQESKQTETDDDAGGITIFEEFTPNCADSGAGVN